MYYTDYEELNYNLISLIHGFDKDDANFIANLSNAAALLAQNLPGINWVGFYLVRGDKLMVGPFQGKPACREIMPGRGVCGTAWEKDEPQVVPDVHEFPGHIACDENSRSEIVIPLHKDGKVVGVLDIDSPELNRFSPGDVMGLAGFAKIIEAEI